MANSRYKNVKLLAGSLPTLPENQVTSSRSQAHAPFSRSPLAAAPSLLPLASNIFNAPKAGKMETMPQLSDMPSSQFDKERLLAIGRGHKVTPAQSAADGYHSCEESDSSHNSETVVKNSPR